MAAFHKKQADLVARVLRHQENRRQEAALALESLPLMYTEPNSLHEPNYRAEFLKWKKSVPSDYDLPVSEESRSNKRKMEQEPASGDEQEEGSSRGTKRPRNLPPSS